MAMLKKANWDAMAIWKCEAQDETALPERLASFLEPADT